MVIREKNGFLRNFFVYGVYYWTDHYSLLHARPHRACIEGAHKPTNIASLLFLVLIFGINHILWSLTSWIITADKMGVLDLFLYGKIEKSLLFNMI